MAARLEPWLKRLALEALEALEALVGGGPGGGPGVAFVWGSVTLWREPEAGTVVAGQSVPRRGCGVLGRGGTLCLRAREGVKPHFFLNSPSGVSLGIRSVEAEEH